MSDFHLGILANAFYTAWSSPNVTPARKNALKTKLIKMALFIRTYGVDPTNQLSGHYIGWNGGENRVWHSQSIEFFNPLTFWDTSHGIALVNLLVIGSKFTGDRAYLDGTPTVATPGVFPAKYVFNRHTKGIYGNPATRECADNVVGHFQDTKFSLPGEQMLAYNKGEFQYTYLIFENGGAPTVSL
jgi:hypothetical protein